MVVWNAWHNLKENPAELLHVTRFFELNVTALQASEILNIVAVGLKLGTQHIEAPSWLYVFNIYIFLCPQIALNRVNIPPSWLRVRVYSSIVMWSKSSEGLKRSPPHKQLI